jgi:hypothetical protein
MARCVGGEADILADGKVREEDRALRGVGEATQVGWGGSVSRLDFNPGRGAGGVFRELRRAARKEAAGSAEEGAFAASGGTEDDGPGGGEFEIGAKVQWAEVGIDVEAVVRGKGVSQKGLRL